jgi:hypothetical protein
MARIDGYLVISITDMNNQAIANLALRSETANLRSRYPIS